MYLIVIGWLYVAVMMAVAEALHSSGGILSAIVTLFLYGFVPAGLVIYLMGTPLRRKQRQQQAAEAENAAGEVASNAPNTSGHAPSAAQTPGIAPVRKEP